MPSPGKKLLRFLNWLCIEDMCDGVPGIVGWIETHRVPADPPLPGPPPARIRGNDPPSSDVFDRKVEELVTWHRTLWTWIDGHNRNHTVPDVPVNDPTGFTGSPAAKLDNLLKWWDGVGQYNGEGAYDWVEAHENAPPVQENEPPPPPDPLG